MLSKAERALAAWPEARGPLTAHDAGRINDTWMTANGFVLQRINGAVFPDPGAVMRNLQAAIAHDGRYLVAPLPTAAGEPFLKGDSGDAWRLFPRLEARNYEALPDALVAAAGTAFGGFLQRFRDFSGALDPVIDGFHDLPRYLAQFDAAPPLPDADAARRNVDALRGCFGPSHARRVIHGDCKVNNLLFHPTRAAMVAIIDLDTLMLGDPAWDFGDLARSVCAGTEEGGAAAPLSLARLQELCRGFLSGYGPVDDAERFAAAPAHMSFMLGVRFLTDHLRGDVYFKTARRGANLRRAEGQLALAEHLLGARPRLTALLEQ